MHRITSLEHLGTLMLCKKKNEENASPHMLKSFFLSEKKLVNEIFRGKLEYMLFAMQKTDFNVLELF